MKKRYITLPSLFAFLFFLTSSAQSYFIDESRLSCTSIMVGKKASVDGSVITSHTCDGNYRTWMDIVPATDFSHDTTAVVVKGRMHTDHSLGERGMKAVGDVPVPGKSYAFLNTAYPCLNEHQLAMGETTIGGRKELENPAGMFLIEELQRLALQHCTRARQAIAFMGHLAQEYGYGDSGECLTIADTDEVWHFEIFGQGPDSIGAVWAAVRIPDGEVGVSANISRISEIDLSDPDRFMASDNVKEVALRLGFWDGKEPFKFWKAYSGTNYFGEPKAYSVRELFILSHIAPSLGLHDGLEELPVSVKPEKPLAVDDVIELLASTYQGTDLDMTKNLKVPRKNKDGKIDTIVSPVANPWMTGDMIALLNALNDSAVVNVRNVSVPQCAYSTVIQLRDWLPHDIGGVAWISLDNPGQSPRIPVFAGVTDLPDSWKIDGQLRYDENAAVWDYRTANKLATVKWGATAHEMLDARHHFIEKALLEMPFVEQTYTAILENDGAAEAKRFITDYTADFAAATAGKWRELGKRFWARFARAF